MTNEEKRIKISEVCGWKITQLSVNSENDDVSITPPGMELNTWRDVNVEIPDYFNDLNAMHETEKVLDEDGMAIYEALLYRICGVDPMTIFARETFKVFSATAAQRAESFGRTLNLWT